MAITGRRLDAQGQPIDGTGFEYEDGGPVAELLGQRRSPVFSLPATGEWVVGLVPSADTGGEYERGLGIFKPGNSGPPEHFHPSYDEHFHILQGEFIFKINGKEQRAVPGDKLIVAINTPHTFRCVGQSFGAVIVETWPAARIGEVISTLFGLSHMGKLTVSGQPKMLQAMLFGSEYADDTVFTNPPPAIAIPVARMLAPLARLLGYRATYPEYQTVEFWERHVEQPIKTRAFTS